MSHLGASLSALVDGELGGAERDRGYAHLAGCEQCRADAAALRQLKTRLRSLASPAATWPELTEDAIGRLIAVGAQADEAASGTLAADQLPAAVRRPGATARPLAGSPRRAPRLAAKRAKPAKRAGQAARPGLPARPGTPGRIDPSAGRGPRASTSPRTSLRRRGYLVLGMVSIVMSLGTAAFVAGGSGEAAPEPRVTPQVELYSLEHAITTGEVPFAAAYGGAPGTPGGPQAPGTPGRSGTGVARTP